jgi:hypothetical protein
MKNVTIKRKPSTDLGTFGTLTVEGEDFKCVTGELPWRDNQHDISCILPGKYICRWAISNRKKIPLYHVMDTPDREGVLIHIGNWCGDTKLGYHSDVQGCILLGQQVAPIERRDGSGVMQLGVTSSGVTLDAFHRLMNKEDFMLTIEDAD